MRHNVMAGGAVSKYPVDNFFPPTADFLAQFVNASAGDYRLASTRVFRGAATDNTDVGADITRLKAVQAGGQ